MKTAYSILVVVILCLTSCGKKDEYTQSVSDFRQMKDEQFRSPAQSPLSKEERTSFTGLAYFPVDPNFKIKGEFIPNKMPQYVSLFSSEEVKQVHEVKGRVVFFLDTVKVELTAYSTVGQAAHVLFIPFSDSHPNTYPGGKYVEAKLNDKQSTCTIDFNLSYNPYCVYNEKYKCAMVPMQNQLNIPISAGEKWEKEAP